MRETMHRAGPYAIALVVCLGCGSDATAPVQTGEPPELPQIPLEATAWIDANSLPFDGTHLTLPHAGVEFLRSTVGAARLVALGENTHGTRDFFEMKARIVRYLVEEMDFDAFAIEATWPEANRLNDYVRTGIGDPAELLSGLYFWTWNTESVLEMIEWIRTYNEAGGDVGFYGFDMQYPGMALHNVLAYIERVDPERRDELGGLVDCLARYGNGPDGAFPQPRYADQPLTYRTACGSSLEQVRLTLTSEEEAYVAASSASEFAWGLRSLRVAIQYHEMVSGIQSRDASMAENTLWILDQLGPNGKLVAWAHNFHVSAQPGAQGWYQRNALGEAMVIFGFSHEGGRFTGVHQQGGSFAGLAQHQLDAPRALSYEHYLSTAADSRFALDLRAIDATEAGSAWLAGPRPFRSVGCCYDPSLPARYWYEPPLTAWYDVLVHFRTTGPTTVLPFRYPAEF